MQYKMFPLVLVVLFLKVVYTFLLWLLWNVLEDLVLILWIALVISDQIPAGASKYV